MCWRGRLISSVGTSTLLFSIETVRCNLRHLAKGQIICFQSIPDNTANRYSYQSGVSKLQMICVVLKEKCVSLNIGLFSEKDRNVAFPFSDPTTPPQSNQ